MSQEVLFIDCEFNSYKGQLISMALVGVKSNSPEFYAELKLPNVDLINDWVKENVVPLLEFDKPLSLKMFHEELEAYLNRFDSIHVMADWPEDIQYFCEALVTGPGTRINTPPLTMEVRRDLDADSSVPHHALWDARAIRGKYLSMEET